MAGQDPQVPVAATARSSPATNASIDHNHGSSNIADNSAPSSNTQVGTSTAPPSSTGTTNKKSGKSKKATDPNETGKLLAAKINQLELDAAGEKDQEAEIEREVKKANRDLTNLLIGMDNTMHKVDTVQRKYTELLADQRRLDKENTKNKKRADVFQKEKDQMRADLTKTISVKDKLEKLCRELQRENKKLKDEQRRIEDNERASREDLSERTEGIFWEIEDLVKKERTPEVHKEGMEMDELFRTKFKSSVDQFELREQHFCSMLRIKESEVHLEKAKAEDQRKRSEAEATKSRTLSTQVSTFSQTETELRNQLNIYVEKFKQVEDTLNNSNDLFLTFRKEMEEMSKKTKRLEKENLNLTRKHDLTNRNIVEMAEERTRLLRDMEAIRKKNGTLESVIRGMQNQGRQAAGAGVLEADTESDYDDEYDDEEEEEEDEGSEEEGEDDDDTEEEYISAQVQPPVTFGPAPPPPPSSQAHLNGTKSTARVNGEVNGIKAGSHDKP